MGAFDGLKVGQINHGYWGNHTSSIDWCETNYAVTPYIAEFINTLSNLPSICLGVYGAIETIQGGLPTRYALGYLGLSLIGLGSTGFHASLKWEWQLLDELPMIYVVSYAAVGVFDTLPTFRHRFGIWGPLSLVVWDIFVTVSYLYLPNPIYHQIAFATILLSTVGRNVVLLHRLPKDSAARQAITRTMIWGIIIFASAFAIWNVDNVLCGQLRRIRSYLGIWGFVLEGHAYWHFGTGYGAFLIITAAIYLQLSIKFSPDAYTFDSDAWFPVTQAVVASGPSSKATEKTGAEEKVPEK